jgi:hypothetical protein
MNPADSMYSYSYASGTWSRLGQNALTAGWRYFQWPYAYAAAAGNWFYCDENAVLYCYSFADGQWSRLGALDALSDVYVSVTGNDLTGSGKTDSPWKTISHAVSAAPGSSNHSVRIHVSAGTYRENVQLNGCQSLLGGYASGFADRNVLDREDATYGTVIDGGAAAPVLSLNDQEGAEREISGFTIQNGHSVHDGGGIKGNRSRATVRFNTV